MIRKIVCVLTLSTAFTTASAQNINFGKITSKDQAFKQYWGLSGEEVKRYQNFMEIAGKYRYPNLSPLYVLSIIADTPEDKEYYAQKAAQQEHDANQREIETAWLVSSAMDGKLFDEMQAFTDHLIGINTKDYDPSQALRYAREAINSGDQISSEIIQDSHWKDGDTWVILLDDRCLVSTCLKQHKSTLESLPKGVKKLALLKTKQIPNESAQQTMEELGLTPKPFDPIEFKELLNEQVNIPLHLRKDIVIR